MTSPTTLVHERLRRTTCPLYLAEIAEGAKLDRTQTMLALLELERDGLAEPISWRLTEKGRLV